MANEKRDNYVQRLNIAKSTSEEYLCPQESEVTKSRSHNALNKQNDESLEVGRTKLDSNRSDESEDFADIVVVTEPNQNNNNNNNNESGQATLTKEQAPPLLKQAYQSLLTAVLDPIAHLREKHNFQLKVLAKIITCDGCHGVLWGIHRQGLQCTKCCLSIHEKCQELVQENCTQHRRGSKLAPSKIPPFVKLDDSMLQLELVNRYQDVKSTYPNYLKRIKEVFSTLSTDFKSDIKLTQQNFLTKSAKQIRTKLKILIISASNLLAKDSCGTSDPYVTIQCGFSRLKRTKTRKKNLNPVWNETLEFEYLNTADGIISDSGNCGNKMIIRVWDEDVGLKAQLDKMLTNEQDDFLGQVVLDINDLSLGSEESYQLRPRHDGSNVSGYLVMRIEQKVVETLSNYRSTELNSEKSNKMIESAQSANYIDEYRCLHRHLFMSIHETTTTTNNETEIGTNSRSLDMAWLLNCFPNDYCGDKAIKANYFKEPELNLMLKQFANKYAINEKQKQIVHLECFYNFYIDTMYCSNLVYLPKMKRDHSINCKILDYMSNLTSTINVNYMAMNVENVTSVFSKQLSTESTHNSNHNNKSSAKQSFIKQTYSLPLKLIRVLSNYRLNFAIRFRVRCGKIEFVGDDSETISETAIDEMREIVFLFRAVSNLIDKFLKATNVSFQYEHIEAKLNRKFSIRKNSIGYDLNTQYEIIKQAVEKSLISYFISCLQLSEEHVDIFETRPECLSERRYSSISSLVNYPRSRNPSDTYSLQDGHSSFLGLQLLANKIEILTSLISEKIPIEIDLNEQLYFSAFYSFSPQFNQDVDGSFRQFCCRILVKQFIIELSETIKSDLAPRMQSDLIRLHLNLHLLIKRFIAQNHLEKSHVEPNVGFLSELFQPFLLEYIRLQEDQFIKYVHKIYDVARINSLAEEIAHIVDHSRVVLLSTSSLDATSGPHDLVDKYSIDLKSTKAIYDLENYYSASVTDFFTIMHELLQTLLLFDSNNSDANLPHQMGFVNLIKSKLLAYSAHVKKEYQKIYNTAKSIIFDAKKKKAIT